ncbi:unnamed protein product [Cunninghamella echinulata]
MGFFISLFHNSINRIMAIVQYIFSTPSNDNTSTPRPRYQRDYTTLTAYTVGLCLIYCILVFYQYSNLYLFNKNNNISSSRKSNNTVNPNLDTDIEVNKSTNNNNNNNNNNNSPLSNNTQLYFLRRWWHHEYRFLNTTFYVGHGIIVLGLIGIHIGFILGYFTMNGQWENDYERYLDYQLRSNRTAQLALVDLIMALALSVRSSVLWRWIGVSNLLTTLPLHKWFGRFSIICTIYHGCYQWTKHYYRQLEKDHDNNTLLQQHQHLSNDNEIKEAMMNWWTLLISNPRYFTGSIMGLCMFILLLGSHPLIRMKWYGFFRFSHLLGFFGILLAGGWHHWVFFLFYIGLIIFWLTDVVYRWYQSIPGSIMDLTPLSRNVVRLKLLVPNDQKKKQGWMQKHMSLLPGQFVFLSFSNNKWKNVFWSHPFSISFIEHNESTPTITNLTAGSGSVLTFYIKAFGNDTQYLYDLSTNFKKNDWPTATIQLSAPYGDHIHACQPKHIYAFYPVIVLIAEGIGITPWLSVLQSLWNTTNDNTINSEEDDDNYDSMKHIYLIWTLRHTDLIDPMINDVYTILYKQSTMMTFQLNWQIYITRDKDDDDEVITPPPTNNLHRDDEHHHQQINIKYHHGRPNYINVLESIRSQHSQDHTILGLCAHEESIQLCGNLARSKRFNNNKSHWEVKSERFEF